MSCKVGDSSPYSGRTFKGGETMQQSVKLELELRESEWEEVVEALATKARMVRSGDYGDFDALDGFDPDVWATTLEALFIKISDKLEKHL